LQAVAKLVEAGKVRPVVDRSFAFEDLVAAFEYLEAGRAKGKVVLDIVGGP
jgi:alcohol dehydrogenase